MTIRWYGLVAPEQAATGDRRMFASQALTFRDFPLYSAWQRVSSTGHQGSVVVGSWDRQYAGQGGVWGAGEFLDPTIVPEVLEAVYLLEKRLIGPSVDLDPDLSYEVVPHPDRDDEFAMKVTRANVHGVTFVMGPAFPQVHITVDNDEEMAILASAGITSATFAVNSSAWRKFPLAPRETKFDFEAAVAAIAAWSGGDPAKFGSGFLWKDPDGNPTNRETYRLPIIDILDGKPYLIPRAVFSAGVIMSGGHGGLYDVLNDQQRTEVQEVITDIYDMLRDEYSDPRVIAPWQRGGRQGATSADAAPTEASLNPEEFAVTDPNHWSEHTELTGPICVDPALTASGVLKPPAAWFADPKLTGKTMLQVTEDGRVFGHLAPWGQCHMAVGKKCQLVPRSAKNYKHFKQGSVLTDDGKVLRVGKITLGTGHADETFGVIPTVEHYDNTGTCVAVVNAGEDRFGVWVAGALVDGVTDAVAAELRRSPLSGDWRRVDGNLELVAALAVNSPGFPVLEEDSTGVYSLIASGVFGEGDSSEGHPEPVVAQREPAFAEVDAYLTSQARAERASIINRAFQDLLPTEEGCGCGV